MRPLPSLLPFLFVFLWSTGFIGAKFGLPYAEPLTFLLARYLLVLVLMTPLPWRRVRHGPPMGVRLSTSAFPACWCTRSIWAGCSWPSSMVCRLA
jgi:drug/metabolite transporter (DMT)-like permease